MDESDCKQPQTQTTHHASRVARAVVSATIFGVTGGALGHWLGTRGSHAAGKVSAPFMKWGMGIFSALLAAYSSLKSSAQEERVVAMAAAKQREAVDLPVADVADTTSPSAMVDANGAQLEGELAQNHEKMRA